MNGILKISKIKDGTIVDKFNTEKIVIVNNKFLDLGFNAIRSLLSGTGATVSTVTKMQFGTGTSSPAITDTTLQSPISPIKALSSVDYTDETPSVLMKAYLLDYEGNGFTLGEAGLLTPSNILVARAIYTPMEKTSDYNFTYEWTFTW